MNAHQLHAQAVHHAKTYLSAEVALLEVLVQMLQQKCHLELGYPSLHVYIVQALQLSDGQAYNLISVARKSIEVPELKLAVDEGRLNISRARRIVSVLTPQNQQGWIEKAQTLPQRELEKEVVQSNP